MSEILSKSIDVDDQGNLLIKVGATGNPITQLGRSRKKFIPHRKRTSGVDVLYTYDIHKDFIPQQIKSTSTFITSLKNQSSNEIIKSYIEMSAEELYRFVVQYGLIDDTVMFIKVDNDSMATDVFFNKITADTNNVLHNVLTTKAEIDPLQLQITKDAPEEAVAYLEPILVELQKVDAFYSFAEIGLDPKYFHYLSGFLDIDTMELKNYNPNNTKICLVIDFFNSGHLLKNSIHLLKKSGFDTELCLAVAHFS